MKFISVLCVHMPHRSLLSSKKCKSLFWIAQQAHVNMTVIGLGSTSHGASNTVGPQKNCTMSGKGDGG